MQVSARRWFVLLLLAAVAVASAYVWRRLEPTSLPPGIAVANGRLEIIQVDIATKSAGRLKDVLVREGEWVTAGQTVARMDTATLEAELHQAEAQLEVAHNAVATAEAVVEQRHSEFDLATNTLKRSEDLVARGFISMQKLDADRTQMLTAKAALVAARSQVIQGQSSVKAAAAAVRRIRAELDDAVLRAPRDARVQYRLAEPGEVLAAGGKVVSLLDLSDVYMTLFLSETAAGKVALGAEARLVLDAAPNYVIPANVSFVAVEAQFTPKTVETATERQKLVFRVKVKIEPELLHLYRARVKAGMPGVAYVMIDDKGQWPPALDVNLPEP